MWPWQRAALIPVGAAVDLLFLLEPRLQSGLGQQCLSAGRGDLQVGLPVLSAIFIPQHLVSAQGALAVPFVFGAGSCETCSEHFAALEDFFLLGSGLLNFLLALLSVSGVY